MDVDNNNKKQGESKSDIDLGALLNEARKNLGLTLEDIAGELRLSSQVIRQLERNEFETELPTTFIRGYIKSYSSFVGLDTQLMLSQFDRRIDAVQPSLQSVQSISRFDGRSKEINSTSGVFKGLTLFIGVVFLTLASWEVWNRYQFGEDAKAQGNLIDLTSSRDLILETDEGSDQVALTARAITKSRAAEPTLNSPKPVENKGGSVAPDGLKLTVAQDLANSTEKSMPPMASIADITTVGSRENLTGKQQTIEYSVLVFDFSDECWVEIVDARGEVLADGIKQAGKHMPLRGVAPFKVILGNPNAVIMRYQGEVYPIKTYRPGVRAALSIK